MPFCRHRLFVRVVFLLWLLYETFLCIKCLKYFVSSFFPPFFSTGHHVVFKYMNTNLYSLIQLIILQYLFIKLASSFGHTDHHQASMQNTLNVDNIKNGKKRSLYTEVLICFYRILLTLFDIMANINTVFLYLYGT
jgi:hypothetical protein